MLARPSLAVAMVLAAASAADAQIVGHMPGPRTRYEWNPGPYANNYGNFGRGSSGAYSWRGGRAYWGGGGYYPWQGYVGPVIVAPFGGYGYAQPYGYGAPYGYAGTAYDPQWPPSYTNYGYSPVSPFVTPDGTINSFPQLPQVPQDPAIELQQLMQQPGPARLTPEERLSVVKPSTPEAQQASLGHEAAGDRQFHELRYAAAAQEYRIAIQTAPDLPDNYFRLGFALAGMRRYEDAVDQFRYGLLLDSSWPQRGESLEEIWGIGNQLERRAATHRIADWVRSDLRNPDRIFLLAVFLHFDGDVANAQALIESAMRVAGRQPYLEAFLTTDAARPPATQPPAAPPAAAQPATPAGRNDSENVPPPPPAGVAPTRRSVPMPPPAVAPPPVARPNRTEPVPQPVPQRNPVEEDVQEKFPDLKSPGLPGEARDENQGNVPSVGVRPPAGGPSLPTLN